jgi:hypothetical protein
MSVLILSILGIVTAIGAVSILVLQQYRIKNGKVIVDKDYNGPAQVSVTLLVVIRFILKRSVYFRKFFMQYMFHIMVRGMYYIDMWSSMLYAKSRNWFVENAVRNRGTVPHFWNHLKVYKKEIDQERQEEEDEMK